MQNTKVSIFLASCFLISSTILLAPTHDDENDNQEFMQEGKALLHFFHRARECRDLARTCENQSPCQDRIQAYKQQMKELDEKYRLQHYSGTELKRSQEEYMSQQEKLKKHFSDVDAYEKKQVGKRLLELEEQNTTIQDLTGNDDISVMFLVLQISQDDVLADCQPISQERMQAYDIASTQAIKTWFQNKEEDLQQANKIYEARKKEINKEFSDVFANEYAQLQRAFHLAQKANAHGAAAAAKS
ncbi:MAG TPA: hypothetical protein VLG50_00825 [Candidatus Saccharimonadales bacterium]|nr:hypothetical protein [Candidatus Saccharimonadales bacterium]